MHPTLKKLAATVAVAGAITAGTAGAASAADGSSGSTGAAAASSGRHPGIRHQVRKAALGIVLEQLGVSRADLRTALKGGQTISGYASSLGKDPKVIAAALTKAADDRIDQAAANGKITQERADTMKSKVGPRVEHFLNRTWGQNAAQAPANA
jgi:uncharacterized protein YidB (DUF937 family)